MATYSVGGKAAQALSLLATGPATLEQIRDHAGVIGAKRRKYFHTLGALLSDGLVGRLDSEYVITVRGLEALDELRAGNAYTVGAEPIPNVRIFERVAV